MSTPLEAMVDQSISHAERAGREHVPSSEGSYAGRFGLRVEAFSAEADAISFYRSDAHDDSLSMLGLALRSGRGLIVVTGDPGTGKTTLVRRLCDDAGPRMRLSYVVNNRYGFSELLQHALRGFGIDPPEGGCATDVEAVLRAGAADGSACALIIDEAQDLDDDTLQRLRLLSSDDPGRVPLRIVLVGQRELARRLARPHLRAVANRVVAWRRLRPLSRKESLRYVAARLECAGGTASIFTDGALRRIARECRGNPRTLGIVCHSALLLAHAQGAGNVSEAVVARALRSRDGQEQRTWMPRVVGSTGTPGMPGWAAGALAGLVAGAIVFLLRGLGPSAAAPPASSPDDRASPLIVPVPELTDGPGESLASVEIEEALPDTLLRRGAEAVTPGGPELPSDAGTDVPPDPDPGIAHADRRPMRPPASERPEAITTTPPGFREVRVTPGRGLRAMARDVYNDDSPEVIARIQQANPQITDVDHIRAGDVLRFPDPQPPE